MEVAVKSMITEISQNKPYLPLENSLGMVNQRVANTTAAINPQQANSLYICVLHIGRSMENPTKKKQVTIQKTRLEARVIPFRCD